MARLRKVESRFSSAMMDGELVLVDTATGTFFSLEDVGLDIWNELDHTGDLDEICVGLEDRFEVDSADCRRAVDQFASDLVARGFAEYV